MFQAPTRSISHQERRPAWLDDLAALGALDAPRPRRIRVVGCPVDRLRHDLTDEEILARLLALNLERAGEHGG